MTKPGRKKGQDGEFHEERRHGVYVPRSGEFEMTEVDWAILGTLPKQGEKVGKFIPKARNVQDIRKDLGDPVLTSNLIAGRLRWLRAAGYASPVKMPASRGGGGALGWQMTPEGEKALGARS